MTVNTELISILDASGSMDRLRFETVNGYNSFIDKQRELPGQCRVSLTTFTGLVTPVYSGVDIKEVAALSPADYMPTGYTALNDGIGATLEREGKRIALQQWAKAVIVCIVTDGAENASRFYRLNQVRAMLEHAQLFGWQINYLATHVDAFATGAAYGVRQNSISSYQASEIGTRTLYAGITASAVATRSGVQGQSLAAYVKDAEAQAQQLNFNVQAKP
jgi:hypothetical protein